MEASKTHFLLVTFLFLGNFSTTLGNSLNGATETQNIFEEEHIHEFIGPVVTKECKESGDVNDEEVCLKSQSKEELGKAEESGDKSGVESVFLRLFNSKNNDINNFKDIFIEDPNSFLIFSEEVGYNPNQVSVFFTHGFIDSTDKHLSTALVSAFLARGGVNVFTLDWSKLNQPPYFLAIQNLKEVAHSFADFLQHAIDKNFIKTSDIHLIGHSLGAHLSGYVGRNLAKRPPVIVGLDPAGPEFITNFTAEKLTHLDADFVEYIETNRYVFGTAYDLGHANYKFNKRAVLQPGCFTPGCSHFRAVEYFAEAVKNPGTFIAINCVSYEDYINNYCHGEKSVIGFPVDTSAKGLYFLTTNGKEPYGRGVEGVKQDNS